MTTRRAFLAAGAVAAVLTAAGPVQAQEVTLTVHHFLSARAPTQVAFIEPWAERIEEQSDGRIHVEIFPSMSLGGRPPELYNQARDGVADIVWTLAGYTPGVFPRTEVFELPGVHQNSARATTLAIQDLMGELAPDFADVRPILIHTHAGNALHLVQDEAPDLDGMAGLRLRSPSRTGAWMIEAMGAEPVGMPVPELPQALSRGNVDGALVPFEVTLPLRLQELTNVSLEMQDGNRFGTSVFLFLMNRDRYEALPEDLRAVIDANSGANIAAEIGQVWDDVEQPGRDAQEASGGTLAVWDAEMTDAFFTLSEQVIARWVEEANANGIDGAALVAAAQAAVASHSGE